MPDAQQILSLSQVTKTFGDLVALNQVSVTLHVGEVHALIGENGAGKSTLMRILAGHFGADAGTMIYEGRPADISSAAPGQRSAIGFVEQEGGLVAELTGAENLILAEGKAFWCDRAGAASRLEKWAESFGAAIDPNVPVGSLTMGQRQRLEILIILTRGARILVLDEPTAALSIDDAKVLADIIKTFVRGGGGVFYISHKLNEVTEIADRITVMRRGVVVGSHRAKDTTVAQLAGEMVGQLVDLRPAKTHSAADAQDLVDVALGVRGESHYQGARTEVLRAPRRRGTVGLSVRGAARGDRSDGARRRVVGVAGVVGSGQTTLAEVLVGLAAPSAGTAERADGPVGYVPENRHRDALALPLSIRDNLMVHMHRRKVFTKGPWFRESPLRDQIGRTIQSSRIAGASGGAPPPAFRAATSRSSCWAVSSSRTRCCGVVAHNPFRGLDVPRDPGCAGCHQRRLQQGVRRRDDQLGSRRAHPARPSDRRDVQRSDRREVDLKEGSLDSLGKLMGGVTHELVH